MPDPKIKVFKYDTDPGGTSTEIADNDDYITQASDKSADVLLYKVILFHFMDGHYQR